MPKQKLTPNQLFMLRMFEKGWGFNLFSSRRGSWMTYWSLRTKGLLGSGETKPMGGRLVAVHRLTDKGREALRQHGANDEQRKKATD